VLYGVGARLDKKPELSSRCVAWALEELVAKSALRRAPPAKEELDAGSLEGISGSNWIGDRAAAGAEAIRPRCTDL